MQKLIISLIIVIAIIGVVGAVGVKVAEDKYAYFTIREIITALTFKDYSKIEHMTSFMWESSSSREAEAKGVYDERKSHPFAGMNTAKNYCKDYRGSLKYKVSYGLRTLDRRYYDMEREGQPALKGNAVFDYLVCKILSEGEAYTLILVKSESEKKWEIGGFYSDALGARAIAFFER